MVIIQLVLSLRLALMQTVVWLARWLPPAVLALFGCLTEACLYLHYFLPSGRIGGLATI